MKKRHQLFFLETILTPSAKKRELHHRQGDVSGDQQHHDGGGGGREGGGGDKKIALITGNHLDQYVPFIKLIYFSSPYKQNVCHMSNK